MVKAVRAPSGTLVHVFFDQQGSPVEDPTLLQQLAMAA
jgi:hypothetical protein